MDFDEWILRDGGYLLDGDDAAMAARMMARKAWAAALASERAHGECGSGAGCLHKVAQIESQGALIGKLQPVLAAAVALVCAPAWAGISDEDVALEQALRNAGMVLPSNGWPDTDAERSDGA